MTFYDYKPLKPYQFLTNVIITVPYCTCTGTWRACRTRTRSTIWRRHSSSPWRWTPRRSVTYMYSTLIKKKIKFSSFIGKFRVEPPHIWGNIFAFPHISGSPTSYMTLQLLHSEFPYRWGKFYFLFLSVQGRSSKSPFDMVSWYSIWMKSRSISGKFQQY